MFYRDAIVLQYNLLRYHILYPVLHKIRRHVNNIIVLIPTNIVLVLTKIISHTGVQNALFLVGNK